MKYIWLSKEIGYDREMERYANRAYAKVKMQPKRYCRSKNSLGLDTLIRD